MPDPAFTGWDADGGFAEAAVVNEAYAYRIPEVFSDQLAAPLLCAGIIGFRALRRAACPPADGSGSGVRGSAHLAAQVAIAEGAEVHVRTRGARRPRARPRTGRGQCRRQLRSGRRPLDGAVLFAPVGDLVPAALETLDRGATLAVAGIYLSDIPPLNYEQHLFQERAAA